MPNFSDYIRKQWTSKTKIPEFFVMLCKKKFIIDLSNWSLEQFELLKYEKLFSRKNFQLK